jgi:hypothetical protein
MDQDVWTSREGLTTLGDEMVGFTVEGRDGSIGKVDHVSFGGTCVVVSTGRILGHKYVIPASTVAQIDLDTETIVVDLTKDDVESSPEYDADIGLDDDCEARVGAHYRDLATRRTAAQ